MATNKAIGVGSVYVDKTVQFFSDYSEICGLKSEMAKTLTKKHKNLTSYISYSYDRATFFPMYHVTRGTFIVRSRISTITLIFHDMCNSLKIVEKISYSIQ